MITLLNANAMSQYPGGKDMKKHMEEMWLMIQQDLNPLLQDQWVTIPSDGWTSRSVDTYLGSTYHLIDNDWTLRSITVDCEKI